MVRYDAQREWHVTRSALSWRIVLSCCDVITIMLWQSFTVEVMLKVISVGTPAIRHIHVDWKISTNNIPFLCITLIILYWRHSRSLSGWQYTSRSRCWRGGMECWRWCVCQCYLLLLQHWQAVTQTIYRCLRSSLQQQHCFINVPDAWAWVKKHKSCWDTWWQHFSNVRRQGKHTCMSTYIALRFVFSVNVYTLIICTLYLYVQREIQTFVNRCLTI